MLIRTLSADATLRMPRPDGAAAGWAASSAPVAYPDAVAAMQARVQAILADKQKAEMAPLAEDLGMCESFIKQHMLDAGLTQAKTDAGMAFFTTKDSVTVRDMDDVIRFMLAASPPPKQNGKTVSPKQWAFVLDHIAATGMWGLLNKAVNKTAAKELIEAQTPPPGVEYSAYKDLSWRRGKSA
jgi:hypothetical protein